MALIKVDLDEHVAVLTMQSEDNRFNPSFLSEFLAALDQVENETEAKTLLVGSAHEKIFSNGLDLEWLLPVLQQEDLEEGKAFFYQLNRLFKRLVTYPLITVAAINGHAFAGGAILACAHDFRFMRSDRGFFCLPEVDIKVPFLPGMLAILKKAIPGPVFMDLQFTGRRMTAQEAAEKGIVMGAHHVDTLMEEAMAFAKTQNKERVIVREMKDRMFKDLVKTIDKEDPPYIESGRFYL